MSDEPVLDVEDRFAIVPEWLLDADISDAAVRLYAVLLRFGQSSGARMPGRATLARRLRKKSTDSVDRAMRELVALGAVVVQHRFAGGQRLTNKYLVRTSRPGVERPEDGRIAAATGASAAGRVGAGGLSCAGRGGRTHAAGVAAPVRHDPESSTESSPPPAASAADVAAPSWEEAADRLKADCGISDWAAFAGECRRLRAVAGQPLARWSDQCLLAALQLAVRGRGWPASRAAAALRMVAADPTTRSPMRVAEAGQWWDEPVADATASSITEDVAAMEAELADLGGLRVLLQRQARELLTAEGRPITRATVTRRAYVLLQEQRHDADAAC